jgi:hypothetical protein
MSRLFTPKPLPKGPSCSMQDMAEYIAWEFQKLTPDEQERFRRETMRQTYHELSATAWNKENTQRPYDREQIN